MPNTVLTPTQIATFVGRKLGESGVQIELVPEDITECLKEAIRTYNRNRPGHGRSALSVVADQTKYAINHPGIQGIVNVDFVDPRRQTTEGLDVFDPWTTYSRTDLGLGADTFAEHDQRLNYREQARRIVSAECEWQQAWEGSTLYLYVSVSYPNLCSYEYSFHFTPDNAADTGMQLIPDGDTDWIMDMTLALAKGPLSKIRGKYTGLTGPDGTDLPIDWDTLREEGATAEERLREDIKGRRRPILPVIE